MCFQCTTRSNEMFAREQSTGAGESDKGKIPVMDKLIKLTFLGDILCEREQIVAVQRKHVGFDCVFDGVEYLWADSNYVLANLETPLAGTEFGLTYEKMRFNAPIEFGKAVKCSGISHVSIANNHALDRGEAGLLATIRNLDAIGLDHSGAYLDEESSTGFFEKEISGVTFAVISCTYDFNKSQSDAGLPESRLWRLDLLKHPAVQIDTLSYRVKSFIAGLAPYQLRGVITAAIRKEKLHQVPDSVSVSEFGKPEHQQFFERVGDKIRKAKGRGDVVIVLPHIGGQYSETPGEWQKRVVDSIIAAGADIVVCNHVHVPQYVERRGDVLVAHCLGNFCFTPTSATSAHGHADFSVLLNVWIDPKSKKIVRQGYELLKTERRGDGISVVTPTDERWLDWRC